MLQNVQMENMQRWHLNASLNQNDIVIADIEIIQVRKTASNFLVFYNHFCHFGVI